MTPSPIREHAHPLTIGLVGSDEFVRRIRHALRNHSNLSVVHDSHDAAWTLIVSYRPEILVVDIGFHYDGRLHRRTRQFLEQLRARDDDETFIAGMLSAPQTLFYGGDLLFASAESRDEAGSLPHGLIDTFLALSLLPSLPSLEAQLDNLLDLYEFERLRRLRTLRAGIPWHRLPALNTPGWAHSLADPTSRELWMRWLPRYASYLNESPLIIGETGTGKTNLAYALHLLSGKPGKFVSITPRDFSSSELVQAELFGAVAGAYTGAVDKWGLVKSAERGTLFIDELQSIDKDLQGKLITFIENKVYRRVGSSETIAADVRFVFASNRTLPDLLREGVLRDDFAYRLERVQLELAPLQRRALDIIAALAFALAKIHRQRPQPDPIVGLTPAAVRHFLEHPWPGNLRQLENTVAKGCERADMAGATIIDESMMREVARGSLLGSQKDTADVLARAAFETGDVLLHSGAESLASALRQFASVARQHALTVSAGDAERAASILGEPVALLQRAVEGIVVNEQRNAAGASLPHGFEEDV